MELSASHGKYSAQGSGRRSIAGIHTASARRTLGCLSGRQIAGSACI